MKGLIPLLRHELSMGWPALAPLLILAALAAWFFENVVMVFLAPPRAGLFVGGATLIAGGVLAARRLTWESETGVFLAARAVERRTALAAKALATLLDLLVLGLASNWVFRAMQSSFSAYLAVRYGIEQSSLGIMPALLLEGACVFAAFSLWSSRWIAGGFALLAALLSFLMFARECLSADSILFESPRLMNAIFVVLLPAAIALMIACALRGTAWRRALA